MQFPTKSIKKSSKSSKIYRKIVFSTLAHGVCLHWAWSVKTCKKRSKLLCFWKLGKTKNSSFLFQNSKNWFKIFIKQRIQILIQILLQNGFLGLLRSPRASPWTLKCRSRQVLYLHFRPPRLPSGAPGSLCVLLWYFQKLFSENSGSQNLILTRI